MIGSRAPDHVIAAAAERYGPVLGAVPEGETEPALSLYYLTTDHVVWYMWFAGFGGLLPGFIALFWGMKQSSAVLEQVSQ